MVISARMVQAVSKPKDELTLRWAQDMLLLLGIGQVLWVCLPAMSQSTATLLMENLHLPTGLGTRCASGAITLITRVMPGTGAEESNMIPAGAIFESF